MGLTERRSLSEGGAEPAGGDAGVRRAAPARGRKELPKLSSPSMAARRRGRGEYSAEPPSSFGPDSKGPVAATERIRRFFFIQIFIHFSIRNMFF